MQGMITVEPGVDVSAIWNFSSGAFSLAGENFSFALRISHSHFARLRGEGLLEEEFNRNESGEKIL